VLIYRHVARRKYFRINENIKAPRVRVIDPKGDQIGVMQTEKALNEAQKRGLDLVEVAPNASPPVCKIVNFHEFLEEQKAKRKPQRKKSKTELKELRLSTTIAEHDLNMRIKRAKQFLEEGNQVRLTLLFRGREITHKEVGKEKIDQALDAIGETGKVINGPQLGGTILSVTLAPK
jgi:translation initiation factor IF-3